MAEFDLAAFAVADGAELQVGVVQLAEDLRRGPGHLRLHGQQLFLAIGQRVRLIPQNPLQRQPVRRQFRRGQELLHPGGGDGHDLGPDIAGGLPGQAGGVAMPAEHPLIGAVGGVLGGLQKGVRSQAFAGAVEVVVEIQTSGQTGGAVPQMAAELLVLVDAGFPGRKGLLPGGVIRKQARQIPGVSRLDLAARWQDVDLAIGGLRRWGRFGSGVCGGTAVGLRAQRRGRFGFGRGTLLGGFHDLSVRLRGDWSERQPFRSAAAGSAYSGGLSVGCPDGSEGRGGTKASRSCREVVLAIHGGQARTRTDRKRQNSPRRASWMSPPVPQHECTTRNESNK
jgi:hypothetical protein